MVLTISLPALASSLVCPWAEELQILGQVHSDTSDQLHQVLVFVHQSSADKFFARRIQWVQLCAFDPQHLAQDLMELRFLTYEIVEGYG